MENLLRFNRSKTYIKSKIYFIILILTGLSVNYCYSVTNKDSLDKVNELKIDKNGHSLLKNGKPFFWMGDTGWLLFTQSLGDVDYYFQDRIANGFNVIQIMVTNRQFNASEFAKNYKGELPFEGLSPVKLNENYFKHIDAIVEKAEEYGLVLAMAPIWGTVMDQVFSIEDSDRAYDFGKLLGKRYKKYKNVIWIVCGEYHKVAWDTEKMKPDSKPDQKEIELIESLANGLEAGHKGANLMTIHPTGWKSSSDNFHDAGWLDFNMIQTFRIGKGTEYLILSDYQRMPYKPTILAEPGYESGGAGNEAVDLRYEGYHSVLSGGFGFTYGCQGVWNFEDNWKELLQSEGSLQMKYLHKLFKSRPILIRVPSQELLKGCPGDYTKKEKVWAARADDGSYAFVYFPMDTLNVEIRVGDGISGYKANAWWYNPRDGKTYNENLEETRQPYTQLGSNVYQTYIFNPPGEKGNGNDWILILDDAGKGFGKP